MAALLLSDILARFLAYVPSRPDGGSEDELMNLAEALGMEHAQVVEAMMAFLTTGVEIAAFDEPTYTSFADRYVALRERGPGMAEMVAREAATRKLKLYDINLTIAAREEQLATLVPSAVAVYDRALEELRRFPISPESFAVFLTLAEGAKRIAEGGGDALQREILRLTELRNRLE